MINDFVTFSMFLVQFWTPSPVTQRRGERVQDHLSAHARAKPIVAHITSTCLIHRRENYSSSYTLQGKMSANEVTTPKKHVKPSLENCKVCGITTQINPRAVISNPGGKTNLGKISKHTAVSMWARKRRGQPVVVEIANWNSKQ